jgi:protocatechuate 3,4-dioxygenase beta subunit
MNKLFSRALPLIFVFALNIFARQIGNTLPGPAGQQAGPAAAQEGQRQANQPKATLRGHVYSMDARQPLKRAQVTLRMMRPAAGTAGAGAPPNDMPLTATTDAQGAFEFKNLEPGLYMLQCTRLGYLSAYYGQNDQDQSPGTIETAAGQELNNLDFTLVRGGVIAGVVADEDGEPLPHAQVSAMVRTWTRGQAQLSARNSASTDDRGNYRIFDLQVGRYYVRASYLGYSGDSSMYGPAFFPNVTAPRDAQPIPVINGAEVPNINFRLRQTPTYTLSGRIIDPSTGQLLTGAQISVAAANPQDMAYNGRGASMRQDGTFTASGLVPGRYRIQIRRPTSVTRAADGTITDISFSGPVNTTIKFFDMPAADVRDFLITADPGTTVKGKVILDGAPSPPQSTQRSTQQSTLNRGSIMLRPRDGSFLTVGSAQLSQDLTFEIPNVPAGDYDLLASVFIPGASGVSYVREVRFGGQDVTDKGLTVTEGSSPQIEVVLAYDASTVNGRLTNEKDEPVSGTVVLVSADAQKRTLDRYFRSGISRNDGQFTIGAVVPGDYLLLAWPDRQSTGKAQDPELAEQIDKLGTHISVGKNGTVTQDVKLTPEIRKLAADQ